MQVFCQKFNFAEIPQFQFARHVKKASYSKTQPQKNGQVQDTLQKGILKSNIQHIIDVVIIIIFLHFHHIIWFNGKPQWTVALCSLLYMGTSVLLIKMLPLEWLWSITQDLSVLVEFSQMAQVSY